MDNVFDTRSADSMTSFSHVPSLSELTGMVHDSTPNNQILQRDTGPHDSDIASTAEGGHATGTPHSTISATGAVASNFSDLQYPCHIPNFTSHSGHGTSYDVVDVSIAPSPIPFAAHFRADMEVGYLMRHFSETAGMW